MKDESYYENLDKRTKEYKTWVEIKQTQIDEQVTGAGDVIEAFTKATGIKSVVEKFFGEDCGCGDRKDVLNDMLPFGMSAINCLEEEDYIYLKSFFSRPRTRVNGSQQNRLVDIYNYVYGASMLPPSGCATCSQKGFIKAVNKLHKYFDAAETLINDTDEKE